MAIAWADVVGHASELASVSAFAQADILAYVNDSVATDFFTPSQLKLAQIYLVAHLGSVSKSKGNVSSGAISSETAGRLSRSYAVSSSTDDALSATSYGRNYLAMVRRSAARVPFVP